METVRAMPILEVADARRSVEFYKRLGFENHGFWGDPPEFAIVQRGSVTLGLKVPNERAPVTNEWWSAYVYVSDAPALRAEFEALGVSPTAVGAREYGLQDFDVVDPDGHRLAFGSDLSPAPFEPGLGPGRGRG